MISQESLNQMQQIPITERIQIIELLLNSVKNELKQGAIVQKSTSRLFKVRQFHLGLDIDLNRAELYTEKNQYVCD